MGSGSRSSGVAGAQLSEANRKFVKQVSEFLQQLEDTRSELSVKAQDRMAALRAGLEEQQETVMPRLQRTLDKVDSQREDLVQRKAVPAVRRAVTGREDMSLRDWSQHYKVIKLKDKMTYVISILFLQSLQYVAMRAPELFRFYFSVAAILLISARVYLYGAKNMQYFLLDYCYTQNALVVANALFAPNNAFFWQINFVAANGPLMWAIVAWRNSLVFHDIDKVTSIFIHFVPAVLTYTVRWNVNPSPMCDGPGGACRMSPMSAFVVPMAVYLGWQVAYLIITEIFLRKEFERNPTLMTSLRWIARDKKNAVHHIMLNLGRSLRILRRDEQLDLDSRPWVPVTLFVFLQLVFTIATFIPTMLFFHVQNAHRVFIVYVGTVALWNGSGFLFEVFVKRYEDSIQKKSGSKKKSKDKSKRASSKRHSKKHRSSSRKGDDDDDDDVDGSVRPKGFCAPPNETERAALQDEKDALDQALLDHEDDEE